MLSFKIAFRYIKAKKSHRAVNVITLIAVIGVAIATMAMVLVLSIFNGFKDLAVNQLSSLDPDLAGVSAKGKVIPRSDSLANEILKAEGVSSSVPTITERALLVVEEQRIPVNVKGIPVDSEQGMAIEGIMLAGEYAAETNTGVPAIQLSIGVANQTEMLPSPDAEVELYVPRRKGRINPANTAASFRTKEFAYSGIFCVNNSDIDEDYVIVPLEAARDLLDYDDEASVIEVNVAPDASSEDVKTLLQKQLGDGYKVLNRLEQRSESFRMISIEKWVTFMMLVCILVIALFNVVSTLSLLAIEKRDNMWTLRALGAPSGMIKRVFIAEGFLVTILGGAIGIVLGVALALVQQFCHVVKLSADASNLTIDYYPIRVAPLDILIIIGVITGLALIVSAVARVIVKNR